MSSWNYSTRIFSFSLCNNVTVLENTVIRLLLNVTNLDTVQQAPIIGIMATGPLEIAFARFYSPSSPYTYVPNDFLPLYLIAILNLSGASTNQSFVTGGSMLVSGSGLSFSFTDNGGTSKHPAFTCHFDRFGVNLSSEATLLNSTRLACAVPPFRYTAREVPFHVSMEMEPSINISLPFGGSIAVLGPGSVAPIGLVPTSFALPFRFVQCWTGMASTSASRGGAGGRTAVVISGHGFDFDATYVCSFKRGPDEVMETAAIFRAEDELVCATPAWGLTFTAGSVTLNLATVAPDSATLKGGNPVAVCPAASVSNQFEFHEVWTQDGVKDLGLPDSTRLYHVSAAGGGNITLRGAGFRSQSAYLCQFGYGSDYAVNSTVAVVASLIEIHCTFPPWLYRRVDWPNVRLFIMGGAEIPLMSSPADASAAEVQLFISKCYTTLSPKTSTAMGGSHVTLSGFGFDSKAAYVVTYSSSTATQAFLPGVSLVSAQALVLTTPSWDCLETVYISLYEVTSTSPLRYRAVDLLSGFEAVYYQPVPEAVAVSPTYLNRLGGTMFTVTGFGFSQHAVEYFGVFTSTLSPANVNRTTDAVSAVSCNSIIFSSPVWDNTTEWTAYTSSSVPLTMYASNQSEISPVSSSSLKVSFVHVNTMPYFDGPLQLWVDVAKGVHTQIQYAQTLSPGSPLELGQELSFQVDAALPTDLFALPPTVWINGSEGVLNITAGSVSGKGVLRIRLIDGGGSNYGGSDSSMVHLVTINVLQAPTILVNGIMQSLENEGEHIVINFVPQLTIGMKDNTLKTFTIQNLSEKYLPYFEVPPHITPSGDLKF
jgi:hypothetical protein